MSGSSTDVPRHKQSSSSWSNAGAAGGADEARAAFLERKNQLQSRATLQTAVDDTAAKRYDTHAKFSNLRYPVLLGAESQGAVELLGPTADSKDDPAVVARENFLARKRRIGSRRLGELGA